MSNHLVRKQLFEYITGYSYDLFLVSVSSTLKPYNSKSGKFYDIPINYDVIVQFQEQPIIEHHSFFCYIHANGDVYRTNDTHYYVSKIKSKLKSYFKEVGIKILINVSFRQLNIYVCNYDKLFQDFVEIINEHDGLEI